jgi:hypothetical protein
VKIVALALSLAALAACEKSSDIAKLEDEAKDLAAEQKATFDELNRRAAPLSDFGQKLPLDTPGRAEAGTLLGEAVGALNQIRATMSSVALDIAAAEKSDAPGEKLAALIDRMRTTFEHDDVVANADLHSVESWLSGTGAGGATGAPAP